MELERSVYVPTRPRQLPPVILHPFSDAHAPDRLTMSARASLILQGLLPGGEMSGEELNLRLLDGRYSEIRMLFYVGKDLTRWLEQCMEVVVRDPELRDTGIQKESFAQLLVDGAPMPVQEKLRQWGVMDYRSIFRRAMGLHTVFADLPSRELLPDGFVRSHHNYADALFACALQTAHFATVRAEDFPFELFASGEYSKLLETQWGQQER
jgi:hypothetical protein